VPWCGDATEIVTDRGQREWVWPRSDVLLFEYSLLRPAG
jgi:hypothetical protein